ncbi:MAG: DNA translocase FtsK 4TM domain-containing protein [Planctomycetota bacterium]
MSKGQGRPTPRSVFLPFAGLAMCAILWPAMVTFDPGDWPSPNQYPNNLPPANACGTVGAWCAYYLQHVLGDGAYPLLLFATLAALLRLIHGRIGNVFERAFGLVLVVTCTSATSYLISVKGSGLLPSGNGGVVGLALGELLTQHLSRWGTMIVILSCLVVGLIFATEGWVLTLPSLVRRVGQASVNAVNIARQAASTVAPIPRMVPVAEGISRDERNALLLVEPTSRKKKNDPDRTRPDSPSKSSSDDPSVLSSDSTETARSEAGHELDPSNPARDASVSDSGKKKDSSSIPTAKTKNAESPSEKSIAKSATPQPPKNPAPIVNFPRPENIPRGEAYPRKIENWDLPPLALLEEPEYGFNTQQEAFVREQAKILERTLEEFRLDARVVEIDTGPVITMFELRLGAGVKVAQIAALANDIARALKAHAIRVVAPISGKNTVGIEVPNLQKEKVRLKELIQLAGKKATDMGLPLFLGKDAGGAALVADLTKMPHMLIAGTTGSGKSVCLNAIILSFMMTKRPDHVKLILIDPKMVELSQYKDIPHLMSPIVTDMKQAEKILEWAVTKMDERYEMLAEARVKNIAGYNALGAEELYARLQPTSPDEKSQICTFMPYIVVVIDELADLMMTSAKEVEHHLARLAQKSRAVGIHIIVATQRPEVKVVTGLIKSNLPSRICFRVASRMDSRIVLDQNGGEVLMGQGDMLFLPPGSHKLLRAQGTYLEDGEVQAILDNLAARAKPEFHPELISIRATDSDSDGSMRDPLFDDAVRIVLESKRGSVSLLQRRLTVGYSRASRLIDQMAAAGIVGDYKGSQAREVTMSLDEWDNIRTQVEADRQAGYAADQDDPQPDNSDPF